MAKLPSPEDLGERPTPRPQLAVVPSGGGFEAQAIAELGAAVQTSAETIQKARRGAQLADAMGKASEQLELKATEYQRDQDFKTAPERFKKDAKSIGEEFAKSIDDTEVRELFSRQFAPKALAKQLAVIQGAAKQEQDYNVASLDQRQDVYAHTAAGAATPLQRDAVLNELRGDLALMRRSGWITDVDAARRERTVLGKIDQAVVTRDLTVDPLATAQRLSSDSQYAPNLDPVSRERWVDQGFRRAESERARAERDAERARKQRGDELLKEAFDLDAKGQLTRGYVDSVKAFVEPSEYRALLKTLEGGERKDDPAAFSELQRLVYDNPKEAERLAFQYHDRNRIKNDTLATVLSRARGVDRQEGPRTEFERSRKFLSDVLKPSEFVPDPAGSARHALAMREYDDFSAANKRTDDELRKKSEDIAKRFAMVDMADLARRTSAGAREDPRAQLEALAKRGEALKADLDAKRITSQKFNQEVANLNRARAAAQRALELNNGR